jgi:hypothetical protein
MYWHHFGAHHFWARIGTGTEGQIVCQGIQGSRTGSRVGILAG